MVKLITLVNPDDVFVAKHREDLKALVERLLKETRHVDSWSMKMNAVCMLKFVEDLKMKNFLIKSNKL